jgi:SAM-dependent methyltransferase
MACPHCQSADVCPSAPEKTWERDGQTYRLLSCARCGGRFTDPMPSAALLDQLYESEFNFGWYRDHYPAKLLDSLHRLVQYRRLGLLDGKRLLDYGGGLGYFSRAARLCRLDAQTIDPMHTRGASTQEQFDLVACHHVLEHAADPNPLVRDLRSALAPSGTLILAVPNGASLGYQRRGNDWVWSQPPFVHIHHFTAAGLRALVSRHGLDVVGEHYYERWDANALADVRLAALYARSDGRWSRARWRWGRAQVNSLLRLVALAASSVVGGGAPAQRSELLLVCRRSARA